MTGSFDLRLGAGTYRLKARDWSHGFTEYWNDKPTLATADDITLASGQFRSGIDIVMDKQPAEPITTRQLPVVSGKPKVGKTLTVKGGAWTPAAVKLGYQWYAGSKPIKNATKGKLHVTKARLHRKLKVVITVSASGYATTTLTVKVKGRVHG